ncbi:hypothetical protein ACX80V_07780 [Arthrobacter sp. MDT3-24]
MLDVCVELQDANRWTAKITRSAAKAIVTATALLLAGSLTGCDAAANAFDVIESASSSAADAPSPVVPASADEVAKALVQLEGIPVKGRAPKTGYTRDEFGPAWADVDHNGSFDFIPHAFRGLSRSEVSWRISDHYPLWCEFLLA